MSGAQSRAEQERAAIVASPTEPRVEYVPRHLANRVTCDCPRVVVDVEPGTHAATLFGPAVTPTALKILHLGPGHRRGTLTAPRLSRARALPVRGGRDFIADYLANLPAPIPSPVCRTVAFSLVPEGRKCHGCGIVFDPATPREQTPEPTRAARRPTLEPVEV